MANPGTNFPNGLLSRGVPVGAVDVQDPIITGSVFFVHSGTGSNSNSGVRKDRALATVQAAINKCTADKKDIIYVLPGHAESITGAGTITCSVAGISIIGLGNRQNRPTFTWTATTSTWLVTAANVTISNIRCTVSVDSVVKGIDISAAGCTLDRVDFFETASVQMLIFINTNASATDLLIQNCRHHQATAGSAKWIDLVGADRARILNNHFHVNATTHIIGGTTTASVELLITGNTFVATANAAAIVLLANSTGFVHNNFAGGAKTSQVGMFALASAYGGLNYVTNTVNTTGIVDPAADS